MTASASEKSEKPTPRRLRDAERRGQIAVSRDLGAAAAFAAAAALLALIGPSLVATLSGELRAGIERAVRAETLDFASAGSALAGALLVTAGGVLPVGLLALLAGVLALAPQTRGTVSASGFAPSPERFDPIAGVKRLVSARALVELVKTLGKLLAVGAAVLSAVADHAPELVVVATPLGPFATAWSLGLAAALRAAAALLLLGAADVLLQRWLHERDLRMTKEEVRRDMKEDEGDPHVKQARKQLHREYAAGSLRAVRTASVVVANPTHVAAALRYAGDGQAPRVVAKGLGELALRIRREAERFGVPVVENRPLARALFRVALDDEVPESLYVAVAELLLAVEEITTREPAGRAAQS